MSNQAQQTTPPSTDLRRRLWPLLYVGIAAAVAYGAFTLWSGAAETAAAARRVGLAGAALLLALSLTNYALRFGRWQFYLHTLGYRVPLWPSLRIYLASFAFTATPGKLGEGVRSFYLKPYGVSYSHSLAALFVERLFDLAATLIFAVLGVLYYGRYTFLVALPILAIALVLLLLGNARFRDLLRHTPLGKRAKVLDAIESASALTQGPRLLIGLLLSLLGWGMEALAFHATLSMLHLGLPLIASIGIYGLAISIGALSFLPGGLGGTEATMILLLKASGSSTADAGAATILLRLATLWFAVFLGVIFALGLQRKTLPATEGEAQAPEA